MDFAAFFGFGVGLGDFLFFMETILSSPPVYVKGAVPPLFF